MYHRCATTEDAVKRTIDVELRPANPEAAVEYEPGDTFSLACPNRVSEANAVLENSGCELDPDKRCTLKIMEKTTKRGAAVPKHLTCANTIREALLVYCDLRALLTKSALRILAEYCGVTEDKNHLLLISSRQGAEEYKKLSGEEGLSIVAVLKAHPSCKPPVIRLFEFLTSLSPRRYSAASSPLREDKSLRFILNVVDRGLCSTWLDEMGMAQSADESETTVAASSRSNRTRAFDNLLQKTPQPCTAALVPLFSYRSSILASSSKDTVHFNPPKDTKTPIVLIATGTGLAPFMGFLEHRHHQRKANPDASYGTVHLFFGCRHEARDFLCRDEIEAYVADETITRLEVAFSRDPGSPAKYVQEKVAEAGADLIKVLQEQAGVMYICGNSNGVVDAINDTITALLQKVGPPECPLSHVDLSFTACVCAAFDSLRAANCSMCNCLRIQIVPDILLGQSMEPHTEARYCRVSMLHFAVCKHEPSRSKVDQNRVEGTWAATRRTLRWIIKWCV